MHLSARRVLVFLLFVICVLYEQYKFMQVELHGKISTQAGAANH